MIKVFTDFNGQDPGGACWILVYEGQHLANRIAELKLQIGDKIILYQDENDFEVVATLGFEYVSMLGREAWVARPDWSTLVRFDDGRGGGGSR